jgi:hypothetical protein
LTKGPRKKNQENNQTEIIIIIIIIKTTNHKLDMKYKIKIHKIFNKREKKKNKYKK